MLWLCLFMISENTSTAYHQQEWPNMGWIKLILMNLPHCLEKSPWGFILAQRTIGSLGELVVWVVAVTRKEHTNWLYSAKEHPYHHSHWWHNRNDQLIFKNTCIRRYKYMHTVTIKGNGGAKNFKESLEGLYGKVGRE